MAPSFLKTLIPHRRQNSTARPFLEVLRSLSWVQCALFFCGWLAWTCDAIDFFSVSLSVTRLQVQFNKPEASTITTAITLSLLFRPVGAIIFGMLSDRFGRKWPLVANLLCCAVFELGASFVHTFRQFLATRCLFGIAMGGIWGLAASTALENIPMEVRGLVSGTVQGGYAVGYLIAAVINLRLVPATNTWRSLFWTSAGISAFAAALRAILPESEVFLRVKAAEKAQGKTRSMREKTKVFVRETRTMLRKHWLLAIYLVLIMAGYNFLSHGSQDLYPTFLQTSKNFDSYHSTVATIIGECGAIVGSLASGCLSQYMGRRLIIIIFTVLIGIFIPLWIIPSSFGALSAGAFFVQVGVQGSWGVMAIHLTELAPPGFRATFPGVAYQLGNMISAASAQIESKGGENLKTTVIKNGTSTVVPDYGAVQGILMGSVVVFCVVMIIIGPENHGYHFEKDKTAFEEASCASIMGGEEETTDSLQDEKSGFDKAHIQAAEASV
ncbi:carboxylic acid transporter, partial [Dentipellis sp. KUC8613]